MKKNGFTLAEVLITLTIIGVIATMTLPALMTNTQEQQAKTALKKGINTLTEAAQLSQTIDGIDYSSLTSNDTSSTDIVATPSLYALLANRTQAELAKSGASILNSNGSASTNYALFFRDGTAILFDPAITSNTAATNAIESDGIAHGIPVVLDTNGLKGPNAVSNCMKNTTGTTTDATADSTATIEGLNSVCDSSNRVIKDQFAVRLRGGFAVPNSAAARWAFNN